MFRIDTTSNISPMPAPPPIGTPGYFQDTDPAGGTGVSAAWLNHVQEEIAQTVEGLGGTLDKADVNQLWGLLSPRVDGIIAHATDTGTVTNSKLRVVIGSASSKSTGARSLVAASETSIASGASSAVVASKGSEAAFDKSIIAGSENAFTGANFANVISSLNCENAEALTLALGYSAVAITKTGASQNRTIILRAITGEIETTGKATHAGGLEIAGATQAAAFGTPWTVTNNAVAGSITLDFSGHNLLAAAAASQYCIVTNNKVDAGSRVHITVNFSGANGFPLAHTWVGAGAFDIWLMNVHPTTDVTSVVTVDFEVINPA